MINQTITKSGLLQDNSIPANHLSEENSTQAGRVLRPRNKRRRRCGGDLDISRKPDSAKRRTTSHLSQDVYTFGSEKGVDSASNTIMTFSSKSMKRSSSKSLSSSNAGYEFNLVLQITDEEIICFNGKKKNEAIDMNSSHSIASADSDLLNPIMPCRLWDLNFAAPDSINIQERRSKCRKSSLQLLPTQCDQGAGALMKHAKACNLLKRRDSIYESQTITLAPTPPDLQDSSYEVKHACSSDFAEASTASSLSSRVSVVPNLRKKLESIQNADHSKEASASSTEEISEPTVSKPPASFESRQTKESSRLLSVFDIFAGANDTDLDKMFRCLETPELPSKTKGAEAESVVEEKFILLGRALALSLRRKTPIVFEGRYDNIENSQTVVTLLVKPELLRQLRARKPFGKLGQSVRTRRATALSLSKLERTAPSPTERLEDDSIFLTTVFPDADETAEDNESETEPEQRELGKKKAARSANFFKAALTCQASKKAGRPKVDRSGCSCLICGSQQTPQWRFMTLFEDAWMDLVCNACYMKFNGSRPYYCKNGRSPPIIPELSFVEKPLRPTLEDYKNQGPNAFPHLMRRTDSKQLSATKTTETSKRGPDDGETNNSLNDELVQGPFITRAQQQFGNQERKSPLVTNSNRFHESPNSWQLGSRLIFGKRATTSTPQLMSAVTSTLSPPKFQSWNLMPSLPGIKIPSRKLPKNNHLVLNECNISCSTESGERSQLRATSSGKSVGSLQTASPVNSPSQINKTVYGFNGVSFSRPCGDTVGQAITRQSWVPLPSLINTGRQIVQDPYNLIKKSSIPSQAVQLGAPIS